MNQSLKYRIAAYVVLGICAAIFATGFYHHYSAAMRPPPSEGQPDTTAAEGPAVPAPQPNRTGAMMKYGAGLFFVVVGLALLTAHDISKFLGNRAEEFLASTEGETFHDPEYDQAEKLWADGHHLDAVQLMREHLKKNPRHQFVALRIAEIYEKDLRNHVAAALEYEEVLKHRLPPERWGWAAIHLANLYSGRLNRPEDAEALLHRIVNEFGQTAAARKARERLGLPEPTEVAPPPSVIEETPKDTSNLPKGFRPK